MKNTLVILLIFFLQHSLVSQLEVDYEFYKKKLNTHLSSNLDSLDFYLKELTHFYKENNHAKAEILYYNTIAQKFSLKYSNTENDIDSFEFYLNKSIEVAKINELHYSDHLYEIGYENIINCNSEKVLNYSEKLEKYYEKTNHERALVKSYTLKSTVFSYCLNEYDSAILYYQNSLEMMRKIQDSGQIAILLENIGMTYLELEEYSKSIVFFEEALVIEQKIHSQFGEFFCKYQMARALYSLEKYALSEQYLLESYEFFKKGNHIVQKSECANLLGLLYVNTKQFNKADKYINIALAHYSNNNNIPSLLSVYDTKAKLHFKEKEYEKCRKTLKKAIKLNEQTKILAFDIKFYELLYQSESKLGLHQDAFISLLYLDDLEDSINSNEQKLKIQEIEEKYENEKKEEQIKLLKSNSIIEKQRQRRKSNFLIGGIVLSSLIGLFLYLLYRNRQKTTNKLKEIDQLKTRFFENISHEFRTPLTLLRLPLSQAITNQRELCVKELNLMKNNTDRLLNLIEDLLSLSELELGKIKLNKSQQDPFLHSRTICSQFNSYAESKNLEYRKNIDSVSGVANYDKSILEKVLSNLITNAIKYSKTNGKVHVKVSYTENFLIIQVSDNGEGISKEDQKQIFERYYQIRGHEDGIEGSGIGLALVKKILENIGGDIEVKSKIGEGSTFIAKIPMEIKIDSLTTSNPLNQIKETQFENKGKDLLETQNIDDRPVLLIAEDSEELLQYTAELFKEEFQILTAKDGKEGLQKALKTVPDIIVSDWMMPNKNGLEFCKEIKSNSITSHIPFILLTAKSTVEDKIDGYETGADSYFSKPFDFNELTAKIFSVLKQRQLLYKKFSNEDMKLVSSTTNSYDIKFWKEFKIFLNDNISLANLSASQIATHLGMSRMQLHRKLTALTGQNLSSFINNQRMQLAAKLLKDSAVRISEVSFKVGYEDSSAFSRAFKKEFGMSPTQFREKK